MLTRAYVPIPVLGEWFHTLDDLWARALVKHGWAEGQQPYRLRIDPVTRGIAGLAAYVTKVQSSGLGNEIARADLKGGRKSSRTPMQILADFGTWGEVTDLDLWHEYEKATQGRSAVRWSRGLRRLLLPDVVEQTDEEVAAEEIGGDTVAYILPSLWYKLADIPGGDALVLNAVEAGGMEGVVKVLVALRLDPSGLLSPDEWRDINPGPVEG